MPIPGSVQRMVVDGIKNIPAKDLQHLADRKLSLVQYMERRLPVPLSLARRFIGSSDQTAIRKMHTDDFEDLLDVVLRVSPTHGNILWQHRRWYRQQMQALQIALGGEASTG